jgi:hypothetical protein
MNRTLKLAVPVLLLVLCTALSSASAQQVAINAEDGGDLPESIRVGETFTVLITEDGDPAPAGTNVVFTLPASGGTPIYVPTDSDGKARYKPPITGILSIKVLDGTVTVAEATVTVVDIPVINAEGGGDLPAIITVGETFTVLITEDGSPVPAGTNVVFTLPASGGTPIYVPTDSDGKARYKPLITGTLKIGVLDGTVTVAEATVTVEDIPVEIIGWELDETAARGTYIDATVSIMNTGTRPLWFVVSVSGGETTTGYPLIGLSAVRLGIDESVDMPVKIAAPSSADVGEYTLTPAVYRLNDYPTGNPMAIGSGKSVTIS